MINKKKIVQNTIFLTFTQILNIALQFTYTIFLARYLTVTQFGKYSFAIVFTQMFLIVADMGLNNVVTREIAKKKEIAKVYFTQLLTLKVVLGIIVCMAIICIFDFLPYDKETKIVVSYLAGGMVLFSIHTTFNSIYQALEKLEYQALNLLSFYVLNISLGITVLLFEKSIITLAKANCLAAGLSIFFGVIIFCKKYFVPVFSINVNILKKLFMQAIPLGLGAIFFAIYNKIDVTMISLMLGNTDVAYYTAAYRLTGTFVFIPAAFFSAMYPVYSKWQSQSGNETVKRLLQVSLRVMALIGLPISAGLFVIANKLILLLYNVEYDPAIPVLKILSWSVILFFVANSFGYFLISLQKTSKYYSISAGLGVFVNIFFNFILIPIYGIKGAAIGTIITECTVLGFYIYFARINISLNEWFTVLKRPIIASVFMVSILYITNNLNVYIILTLGILSYIFMFTIFNIFVPVEFKIIKEFITTYNSTSKK